MIQKNGWLRAGAITTNIVGGLGNQLFLVANLVATAKRNNLPAYVERIALSDSCEAPRPTYWASMLSQLDIPSTPPARVNAEARVVPELRPAAPIQGLDPNGHHRLVGFFQSDTYFADCKPEIHRLFTPPACMEAASDRFFQIVPDVKHKHVIGLHVRRGDYLRMTDVFEIPSHQYYMESLEMLCGSQLNRYYARAEDAPFHVLVFSDDKQYGRTLCGVLRTRYPAVRCTLVGGDGDATRPAFVDAAVPEDVSELLMMSLCNDLIIANSSFSWWGAYLNDSPMRRIVAPAKWFVKDPFPTLPQLYCDGWIVR
jgi:hypothetical protein